MDDQTARKMGTNDSQSNSQSTTGSSSQTNETGFDIEYVKDRAKSVLTNPKGVWAEIRAEELSIENTYRKYLVPLAAIPAISQFIGFSIVGVMGYRQPLFSGIIGGFVSYAMMLLGFFVAAKVMEQLAPKFKSEISVTNALKLVAFASTPAMLGGIFSLIPALSPLGIFTTIYALYLMYVGLPRMADVAEGMTLPFLGASAVASAVIMGNSFYHKERLRIDGD